MGHIRLGRIPKSRRWTTVVSLLASERDGGGSGGTAVLEADVAPVATATLEAARQGLERAVDDRGLRYTFYLLTQIVLAAREDDWQGGLRPFGIVLPGDATLFDLTAGVHDAVDDHLAAHGRPTDVSEMAQQAAGEALAALAGPRVATLFGSGRDELQAAVRGLSTKQGFADLGQRFFGRFMAHYLNFYLSRVTATHLGDGPLRQIGDITQFDDALRAHCQQSARVVHDYCGEWYSKTEFREGISLDNTSRFMAVAVNKLRAELGQQVGS